MKRYQKKKEIPITRNFSKRLEDQIGWATIDCAIPINEDMTFSLGGIRNKDGSFDLQEISLVPIRTQHDSQNSQ